MILGYIKQWWHCLINLHRAHETYHFGKLSRLGCADCREVFYEVKKE